jgi:threonine/homoserine/homoserine lactone efflux protein
VAGIALLLKEFPRVYHIIRYAGALYLIWLGLSSLWEARKAKKSQALEIKVRPKQGFLQCLRQGFLTNILNPKATLFILGIYTSVIPADASVLTLAVAGFNMALLTTLWFSLVSWLFSSTKVRDGYSRIERGLSLLFSAFFILVGVTLFF